MIDTGVIHCGDCVEVMRSLPDCSVDAVVCDPPYGLEFMGKEWDRCDNIGKTSALPPSDKPGFKGFRLPNYSGSSNVKCRKCGRWQWDYPERKCTCEAPDFPNVKLHQARIQQDWHLQWATEALRVLKPGGHLLAFGGSRTYHRMACAVEDAGFEVRDQIMWLYGSGFPKSLDVSKAIDKMSGAEREVVGRYIDPSGNEYRQTGARRNFTAGNSDTEPLCNDDRFKITAPATPDAITWDGWGTALKPAHEPIVVARKPFRGTVAANVLQHGTGALNIGACRVGSEDVRRTQNADGVLKYGGTNSRPHHDETHHKTTGSPAGRWPANIILDEQAAYALDQQSGTVKTGKDPRRKDGTLNSGGMFGMGKQNEVDVQIYTDTGGTSRFFKQCDFTEDELCELANIVAGNSSQPNHLGVSVLSLAAIVDSPEDKHVSDMIRPFTNAIQNALRQSGVSNTQAILNTGAKCLQGLLQISTDRLKESPANVAGTLLPTSIMMIIQSLMNTDGFVESVMSDITVMSWARGEAACRLKYCAKASRRERNAGLEGMPERKVNKLGSFGDQARYQCPDGANRVGDQGSSVMQNHHPTVKPLSLMRYLCRLITPPGGIVLDPFTGSGSTCCAAVLEGFRYIGIDMDAEYCEIARRRVEYWTNQANADRLSNTGKYELFANI